MRKVRNQAALLATAAILFPATSAFAQSDEGQVQTGAEQPEVQSETGQLETILVTARKKTRAESLQEVPIAITAMGEQQIADAQLVTLADLGSYAPNVQAANNGTFAGVANFTIRGLAVNSSIPSLEPAVGVFVDGVYLGTNYGVVLDTFDLESIEVLRGPQGTLQGRNVTGGAVLVRTRRPGDELSMRTMLSLETGPAYTAAASVDGPIAGDVLKAKLTGYYKNDEGWFTNGATGRSVGQNRTWFVRPAVTLNPMDGTDVTAIYERGRIRGDGTVAQNIADPTLSGFELEYNEPGYVRVDWEALTVEANVDVQFGNGTITNIFGVRTVDQDSLIDLDASTDTYFHAFNYLDQRQISNELRYAGSFGPLSLTVGGFYFKQDYFYLERRFILNGLIDRVFGGRIDQDSLGIFSQADIELTSSLTVTAGLRYSTERKTADVDRSPAGLGASNCDWETKTCPFTILPEFKDSKRWSSWTPKVGISWYPVDEVLVYGSWSAGVRSGGYNVRSTSSLIPPGPFDEENQNAFELGFKADLANRKVRLNGAVFYSDMSDLQRDIVFVAPPPEVGTVQVVRNAVDADIYGFEAELIVLPTDWLRLQGSVGYTEAQYKNVVFDLNQDGLIDEADEGLDPPRLAPWTYNIGATATLPISNEIALRGHVDFGYRSEMPVNDANTVFIDKRHMLNAFVELDLNENLQLSVYGKNLLNEVWNTTQVVVSVTPPPYTFNALDKGRVIGASLKTSF